MKSLLLICLLAMVAGTVWGSVKLMARERARKGEERREGVQGGKLVETLAGREVFFSSLKFSIFESLAGRDGRAWWNMRWRFQTSNMRMITNQVILTSDNMIK